MTDPKSFQTLRGFIAGKEPNEPVYFAYGATLRISGENLDFATQKVPRILSVLFGRTIARSGCFAAAYAVVLVATLGHSLVSVPLRLFTSAGVANTGVALAFGLQFVFLVALSWELFAELGFDKGDAHAGNRLAA